MSELNGTNSSDKIILNEEAPTLNDILTANNNSNNIDDLITKNAEKLSSQTDSDMAHNDSERATLPQLHNKVKETDPLSLNILSKHKDRESIIEIVQVPLSMESSDNNNQERYGSNYGQRSNTLNESIATTINRDLSLIYTKIKYVVNPFMSKEKKNYHIRQWDLWGPLLLNLFLALTLSFGTKEKSQMVTLIFVIFWLGGVILYLNANFLGVQASIFQMFCLLGYCLFPLNLSAIIVTLINFNDIIRLVLVCISLFWSIHSSSDYLKIITKQEVRYLVLYPCILFYLYISWFIFSAKIK